MPGPLHGYRVVDLTSNVSGPLATMILADQDADVIKVEVADADVFVQNFRPGVADRLGVGEEAVRAVSPRIVYVSISGFGEKGPYAAKPAYDPVIQGFSGLATVQAGSDEARPRLLRTILPDKLTAITASQAAITAPFAARKTRDSPPHPPSWPGTRV